MKHILNVGGSWRGACEEVGWLALVSQLIGAIDKDLVKMYISDSRQIFESTSPLRF